MRFAILPSLLLSLAFMMGSAGAGELDIMALRGNSEDGRPQVNVFQAPWRMDEISPGSDTVSEARTPISATPLTEAESGSYLQWRNSCVPVEPRVVGHLLKLDAAASFGQVAPYVEKAVAPGDSFLNVLVGELSGEPAP